MLAAPDNSALQVFYGTLPLMGAVILAIWNNNARLTELSKRMDDMNRSLGQRMDDMNTALNKRIDDLTIVVTNGFKDMNERLGRLESRVADLEKGLRLVQS
jgi:tetrahydromethanopterin S-methyltransferase subunit G